MFRVSSFGFQASGFGFRGSCLRFRVSCFGLRVSGFGFRAEVYVSCIFSMHVKKHRFRVKRSGGPLGRLRVEGVGFTIRSLGLRVQSSGFGN